MDAILLAAGNSVRFGGNKLLCPVGDRPMYRHILERLWRMRRDGLLEHVIVVSQYETIFRDVREHFPELEAVENPHPEKGISGSIRLGISCLQRLYPQSDACLFTVADQPFLTMESLTRMIRDWQAQPGGILAASGQGRMGNPVIFSAEYYAALQSLRGDTGGKAVLRANREHARFCELPPEELKDLDTRDEMELLSFPFLREQGHVISLVGAGGKTTLLFVLADYYARCGRRVVVTTTTHIMRPDKYPVVSDGESLQKICRDYPVVVAGVPAENGKLRSPFCLEEESVLPESADCRKRSGQFLKKPDLTIEDCLVAADVVLIEADGAKRLPCKVPAQWEPVIPEKSDIVIGVMGMDTLGRTLGETCFRKREAMEFLGTEEDHVMNEADLVRILSSARGTRKNAGDRDYYVVLNKCDDEERMRTGQRMKVLLQADGILQVACVSLKNLEKGRK